MMFPNARRECLFAVMRRRLGCRVRDTHTNQSDDDSQTKKHFHQSRSGFVVSVMKKVGMVPMVMEMMVREDRMSIRDGRDAHQSQRSQYQFHVRKSFKKNVRKPPDAVRYLFGWRTQLTGLR